MQDPIWKKKKNHKNRAGGVVQGVFKPWVQTPAPHTQKAKKE
jgi:hypothetical protein